MSTRQRTAITVSTNSFDVSRLEISKEPYAPPRGGKLVNMRYRDTDKLNDIFRFQLPEVTIGNVWENRDPQTNELASFTIALNLHTLRAADVDESADRSNDTPLKAAQRSLVESFADIDQKIIQHAAENAFFTEKGKPLPAEKVEGKYTSIVHWPNEDKYTLSIRAKINVRDTELSRTRNFYIMDQEGRDITYYKLNPENDSKVYLYDEQFNQIEGEPIVNMDILRIRGLRVLRSVIESNNIWIQTGLSCSWKIIRLQVENVGDNANSRDAWASDESPPKRHKNSDEEIETN